MWFDDANDRPAMSYRRIEVAPRPTIDAEKVMFDIYDSKEHTCEAVKDLAVTLGVTYEALSLLACGYSGEHKAFAFPMWDGSGRIIGIRLRDSNGRKWAVTGSRQGIFSTPRFGDPKHNTVFIAEGPTDTAAVLSMGLPAIGRPSCNACIAYTLAQIARDEFRRAVIITDNDDPGIKGAMALQAELNIPSCILVPPAKDIREFYTAGGTRELLESIVNQLTWKQPKKPK